MKWAFRYIETGLDGTVELAEWISFYNTSITVEMTVGNEQILKSGDLTIETPEPFAPQPFASTYYWLAAYWNGSLHSIYQIEKPYETHDTKLGIYKHRLISMQNVFYNALSEEGVIYQAASGGWGYDLTAAKVVIDSLRVSVITPSYLSDRWGFSLGDMLQNMVGAHESRGYEIFSVNHPLPVKNENVLPILFRGSSFPDSDAESYVVGRTFADYDTSWLDIFKIALYAWYCYLYITPAIVDGVLGINVDFISKKTTDLSDPVSPTWLEMEIEYEKYRIGYVRISGSNFAYEQGSPHSQYRYEKSLNIYDPENEISTPSDELYWAAGDYDSGSGKYDILDGDNQNTGYSETGALDANFDGILNQNNGVKGEIIYNGEILTNKLVAGDYLMQPTKLTIDESGIAKIEGILLND